MAAEPPKASAPAPDDAHIHFKDPETGWYYIQYSPEQEPAYLPAMRELISRDLSEPYSIYVYRYFLYSWPDLCFLCISPDNKLLGVVINKLEPHTPPSKWGYLPDPNNPPPNRGYIAMLATHAQYRKRGIASKLVKLAISAMKDKGADEVVLETEVMNEASLRLYGRLGFVRSKKLYRYYLNGNEAFRLVLNMRRSKRQEQPSVDTAGEGEIETMPISHPQAS